MEGKSLLMSKTFWFNVAAGVIAVAEYVPQPYGMVAATVGNIVLRTWFTDKPITGVVKAN